jgi:hypothetical protein
MSEITNEFYTITTSTGLITLSLKKSWKKINPGLFIRDWNIAKSEIEDSFNVLFDLIGGKDTYIFGFENPAEIQQKFYNNGCKKIAVLASNVVAHQKYLIQRGIQDASLQKVMKYFFVEGKEEEILEENRLKEIIKAKVWLTI